MNTKGRMRAYPSAVKSADEITLHPVSGCIFVTLPRGTISRVFVRRDSQSVEPLEAKATQQVVRWAKKSEWKP